MNIAHNINSLNDKLNPFQCRLIAVSKKKPVEDIMEAYKAGHMDFGENTAQELIKKADELPSDIRWHMIGHLQRNKVKHLAKFVHLIHSVDSERLLAEIEKQATKAERVIPCLLQVHIATEVTKFGLSQSEVLDLLHSELVKDLRAVKITGLMGMASYTDNREQVKKEFEGLKAFFDEIKGKDLPGSVVMKELSMGMTGDYDIALETGSTMVRIGSAIFGPRI